MNIDVFSFFKSIHIFSNSENNPEEMSGCKNNLSDTECNTFNLVQIRQFINLTGK